MSKQVRWQIPFVSRLGTAYRVDIYDEGYTGTPVQLLGGTSPFTTSENDSDDYFEPIRPQTGTIEVCTNLLSVSMDLPFVNILHKWDHTIHDFLCKQESLSPNISGYR